MKPVAGLLAIGLTVAPALAGCDRRQRCGAGRRQRDRRRAPPRGSLERPLDTPSRLLLDSTAQGLVRFDAAGQIEPGLAERWIVIDGGMSYIFRLRDTEWSDGRPVSAPEVVAVLRRQIAPRSRNPLLPFLSAIDEIVEMTPEVIEIRLKRPRPDLLKLFAQPELAIFRTRPPGRRWAVPDCENTTRLRHAEARIRPCPIARRRNCRARSGDERGTDRRTGSACGRAFRRAPVGSGQRRYLHRLAAGRCRPMSHPPTAGSIPRPGCSASPSSTATDSWAMYKIVPRSPGRSIARRSSRPSPRNGTRPRRYCPSSSIRRSRRLIPGWATASPEAGSPRDRVLAWQQDHPGPIRLRLALPAGPGATILHGYVAAGLRSIGIEVDRVATNADADLRLVDAVAPYDSARWYLATACQPCGADAQAALDAARDAPSLVLRSRYIAQADRALADDVAFIPIARPLRWSLVSLRLKQWQGNTRAWHPLNHLRNETN